MNKENKNKIIYRTVVFCIAVFICTGFIIANNIRTKQSAQKYDIAIKTPTPSIEADGNTEKAVSKPAENVPKITVKPVITPKPETKPVTAEVFDFEKLRFPMPTEGKIIEGHSGDKLVYSKAFDDWRVHKGVDIAAKESAQVRAVADGVISKVSKNELESIVIEIDHNEFKTVYSNVSTDKMVEEGKSVKAGDIISGIGKPTVYSEPHMHFELIYQGNSIDPARFFAAE